MVLIAKLERVLIQRRRQKAIKQRAGRAVGRPDGIAGVDLHNAIVRVVQFVVLKTVEYLLAQFRCLVQVALEDIKGLVVGLADDIKNLIPVLRLRRKVIKGHHNGGVVIAGVFCFFTGMHGVPEIC